MQIDNQLMIILLVSLYTYFTPGLFTTPRPMQSSTLVLTLPPSPTMINNPSQGVPAANVEVPGRLHYLIGEEGMANVIRLQ